MPSLIVTSTGVKHGTFINCVSTGIVVVGMSTSNDKCAVMAYVRDKGESATQRQFGKERECVVAQRERV